MTTFNFGRGIVIPKTGQIVEYTPGDDGTYKAGCGIDPRYIDNSNGVIIDRNSNFTIVKDVSKIIPGASVISTNQINAAGGNWLINNAYAIGNKVNDPSVATNVYVTAVNHTSSNYPNWAYDTLYSVGNYATDTDTTTYWKCLVQHTSASSGTFADDRAANPTYWSQITDRFAEEVATYPTYWRATVWTTSGSDIDQQSKMNFTDAVAACQDLEYAGYTDWRIPNKKELDSITDISASPTVNATYFPNVKTDTLYWTGSTDPTNASNAFAINFATGEIISKAKTDLYYVIPIRGGI